MRMLSSSLTMIELVKLHNVACKGLTAGVWFSSSHRAQYPGCRTWAWPASLLTFWASEWDQVGVCQRLSLSQAESVTYRRAARVPLSWSHRRPAHWDLQPDCSARRLHDRRLYDVDQPLHHWNALPLFSGQSVFLSTRKYTCTELSL